jgi:hypothetical protein
MFERTFSLESNITDLYSNGRFAENNYRDFRLGIIREEKREFAAKVCLADLALSSISGISILWRAVAWALFLTFFVMH